jgi:transcriptional regulator with XRE-family HTH domain
MSIKDEQLVLLGRQIKKMRKSKGFSQIKLAVFLDITREHLSKIERGEAYPSVKILFKIADILNIKFSDLADF